MAALCSSRVRSRAVILSSVLVPALLVLALACSKPEQVSIEVTVDPATVEVAPEASIQLQATVAGTSDTRLHWEVASGDGSVDDDGLYTAPAQEGKAQVRATSVADPLAFAHVLVTVKKPVLPLSLEVLPSSRKIGVQGTTRFSTQLANGTGDEKFEWILDEGPQAGHFNVVDAALPQPTRIYTAPTTPGTYHLSVRVIGRPEVAAHATLTVVPETPTPTLRGTIHYSGQKTGKVYVLYAQGDENGNSLVPQVSTCIEGLGEYSLTPILGSRNPTFLMAFLDAAGSGWLNLALDPVAIVPFSPTGEDQAVDLTLADLPQNSGLSPMADFALAGMEDGFLLFSGSLVTTMRGLRAEVADSYDIAWTPTSGQGTAGQRTLPAGKVLPGFGHALAVTGLAPGTYSVSLTPRRGDSASASNARSQPVTVGGRPATGATVSGKVLLSAPTDSGSVYIGITNGIFTRVPATSASVTWSISGLPPGGYRVVALLDEDGDGYPEKTTPSVDAPLSVTVGSGGTVSAPDISFQDPQPFLVQGTTVQQRPYFEEGMAMHGGLFESLVFQAGGKWPVAIRVTGPGAPFPFDLASSFNVVEKVTAVFTRPQPFRLSLDQDNQWAGIPEGTPLTAEILNSDGSRDSVPFTAPIVMPIPELKSPVGNEYTDSKPILTWALPGGLPSTGKLRISLDSWNYEMPVSQSSVTYGTGNVKLDGLGKYRTYTWMLELSDGKGNFSRAWDRFYVGL